MRRLVLTAALLVAPIGVGCAETQTAPAVNPLKYAEDAKKAYDKAVEAFLDKDWEEAKVLFGEVKRKYAYTKWAREAELRLADIDFEQEKYTTAITGYRSFAHDHRTDEGVPYARFRICKALFSQVSDTVLLPPQEERDQGAIMDAYRELNSFLIDHPDTRWSRDAKFMLLSVTDRLVRHELYVARYYLREGRFEPAMKRVQYALSTYDGSGLEPEAMLLLAETYLKMKKVKEGKQVLAQLFATYPGSPFVDAARKLEAEVEQRHSAVP